MRALVVGGDGKIGAVLVERLRELGHEVAATTARADLVGDGHPLLRLEAPALRLPMLPYGGETPVVYLVAAITSIIRCEADRSSWRVNADAPAALAMMARSRVWRVVFVSSDAVEIAPHLAYARQKAYAEGVVLGCGGCVARLPRIESDQLGAVADFLINIGVNRRVGLLRWPEDGGS